MEAQKRKLETNLITLGTGVILFGIWTFIKFAISFILFGTELDEVLSDEQLILGNIFIWIFSAIEFLLRCYIGFSARSEGKGKHKSVWYLLVTGIFVIWYFVLILLDCGTLFAIDENYFDVIVTIIIDITSLVFLIEVFLYSVKLRKLRKAQLKGQGKNQ